MSEQIKVLIAEDDRNLQTLFFKAFKHADFIVELASDGYEAIEKLSTIYPPDILILDLGLPGISGTDILSRVKNASQLSRMKVIVVSGNHQAGDSVAAERADLIMVKPVSIRDLVTLAGRLISLSINA